MMSLKDYAALVTTKIEEAAGRGDFEEVLRLMTLLHVVLTEEIEKLIKERGL